MINFEKNKTIQGLWIGGDLSVMERLSITSFLKNGHEYHLYTYSDIRNIPAGTIVRDGNEILSKDRIFTYQSGWGKGSYAGFADLFRIYLMYKKGGWWADTDIVSLKPFDFDEEYVFASSFEGKWGEPANNCTIKMPPNSDIGAYLIEEIEKLNMDKVKFGETGPHLLQKAIKDLSLQEKVAAHDIFCPISWRAVSSKIVYSEKKKKLSDINNMKDFLRPILRPYTRTGGITKRSFALHLWNEIWRNNAIDKNKEYNENCLYEILKARYLD